MCIRDSSGTAQACEDYKLITGDIHIQILQIILIRTAYFNKLVVVISYCHFYLLIRDPYNSFYKILIPKHSITSALRQTEYTGFGECMFVFMLPAIISQAMCICKRMFREIFRKCWKMGAACGRL